MQDNRPYNLIKSKEGKDFIKKIPNNIKDKSKIVKFKKSTVITLKGNTIKNIYISLQGKMQVKNEFENGFTYNFAEVESIAYIGAMEIMANKEQYSSTLQTTTECVMIEINVSDFISWINTDPNLSLDVLKFVSRSMYKQSLNKGEVLAYPAIYTLISYLITVYENEDDEVVYIQKSRDEIGAVLGFSIRTINRNLKILKEENLVCVERKYISISNEQFKKLSNKLDSIK